MTARIATALALAERARAALDAAGLGDVLATINPRDVLHQARAGIVLIQAPTVAWVTRTLTEETWTLQAVAGPAENPVEAWTKLDAILTALGDGLNVYDAKPGSYQSKAGDAPTPAYTLRLSTED